MTVKKNTALAFVGLLVTLIACKDNYVDPSVTGTIKADSAIQAYIQSHGLSVSQNSSGVYYAVTTKNPTGKTPATGDEVAFLYNARLLTGALVDTTQKDTLIYIPLGAAGIVTGVQEVIRTMHVGETASLFLYNGQPILSSTNTTLLAAYTPYKGLVNVLASLSEDEQIDQYVANNKLTVTEKTSSGLRFIKTLDNPTGTVLTAGQTVTVKYSGILIRGSQPFDPGTNPLVFTLGKNQVIPGFEEGIIKLKKGEKATIIFPSSSGYGAQGQLDSKNQYVIKPYSPLIFTLEILAVQ